MAELTYICEDKSDVISDYVINSLMKQLNHAIKQLSVTHLIK